LAVGRERFEHLSGCDGSEASGWSKRKMQGLDDGLYRTEHTVTDCQFRRPRNNMPGCARGLQERQRSLRRQ
jgi:hypothetical protein